MDKRSVLGKVILIAVVGWIFGMGIIGFSSGLAEEITITTYYPSPYGVYKELRAQRQAIGENYYDSSDHCWPGGPVVSLILTTTQI